MTVQELMELLEDCNPDDEVRMVIQRNYPLEGGVFGVATSSAIREVQLEEEDEEDPETDGKVYIAIDVASEYAPNHVWTACERGY